MMSEKESDFLFPISGPIFRFHVNWNGVFFFGNLKSDFGGGFFHPGSWLAVGHAKKNVPRFG